MASNPEMNVVVFQYKTWGFKRHAIGYGPTRASDSVQTAWKQVQAEKRIAANQVRERGMIGRSSLVVAVSVQLMVYPRLTTTEGREPGD